MRRGVAMVAPLVVILGGIGRWPVGHITKVLSVAPLATTNTEDPLSNWNDGIIEEFRANSGHVAAFATQPLLLLTHKGAKSGTPRTNPVAYFRDGDTYVIVASKSGAPTNPDWYHNLRAHPAATAEVGTETFAVIASEVDQGERLRLWELVTTSNPAFKEYELKTERTIPLFVLRRNDD